MVETSLRATDADHAFLPAPSSSPQTPEWRSQLVDSELVPTLDLITTEPTEPNAKTSRRRKTTGVDVPLRSGGTSKTLHGELEASLIPLLGNNLGFQVGCNLRAGKVGMMHGYRTWSMEDRSWRRRTRMPRFWRYSFRRLSRMRFCSSLRWMP